MLTMPVPIPSAYWTDGRITIAVLLIFWAIMTYQILRDR